MPGFDLAWHAAAASAADDSSCLSRPVMTYVRHTRPYRALKEMLMDRVGPDVTLFPSSPQSACFRLGEADLGVAVLPRASKRDYVPAGTLREFDPGWVPAPLRFSASCLGEPRSHLVETAAKLAYDVGVAYQGDKAI